MAIAPALTWRRDVAFVGQPVGGCARIAGKRAGAPRCARRRAVIKGGDAVALPDLGARAMRERGGVVQTRAAQRNERKHVERADPRMEAAVAAQVDPLERDAGEGDARHRAPALRRRRSSGRCGDGRASLLRSSTRAPVRSTAATAAVDRRRVRGPPKDSERSRRAHLAQRSLAIAAATSGVFAGEITCV